MVNKLENVFSNQELKDAASVFTGAASFQSFPNIASLLVFVIHRKRDVYWKKIYNFIMRTVAACWLSNRIFI
jgi:hypothetical protein